MHKLALLHVSKYAKSALGRNQAADDLLCHVLGRCAEQIFQLDAAKFLNNGRLLLNRVLESRFELVQLSLLLVKILDKATAAFLHLIKSALQTHPVGRLVALPMLDLVACYWVLGVPHIVRYKLFNLVLPAGLKVVIVDIFDLVHEALHILDQDIVASDQDTLLRAATAGGCSCRLTAWVWRGLCRGLSC